MATTKANQAKDLAYYMGLPYNFILHPDPDGGYAIEVAELRGCISQGETADEAMKRIREAMEVWIEGAMEDGHHIPEPNEDDEFSGKFLVRVPKAVHGSIARKAKREGVSLNLFVATTLAASVAGEKARV